MTILQILNGESVNMLQVNVLKEINPTQFVVGDQTGLALLTVQENGTKFIEVGKGVKMVKPSKVDKKVIQAHPKFNPMKTKAMMMDINYDEVDKFEASNTKTAPANKGIMFSQVEEDFGDNAVIAEVIVYVTSTSRKIDGKFGPYQICNIVDCDGSQAAINLYKSFIDKLEANKVYRIEKLKKTTIKSSDEKLRLGTTNFTKITEVSKSEAALFDDVKIADEKLEGICIMFNNLDLYQCCKKHNSKLDDDGCCSQCGHLENNNKKVDFRCSLVIEVDDHEGDNLREIVIFKRHLKLEITEGDDEEKLIDILENFIVGKTCTVHFNKVGEDNNIAVKVTITS